MKVIPDFENELKQIDDGFTIKINPNIPEMAGLYWHGEYICGLPSGEIYDERKELYVNSAGLVHRTRQEVLAIARKFIERIKYEEGFLELMTDKDLLK